MRIKKIFLNIISFGSPKSRIFIFSSIFSFLILLPTKFLEKGPTICVFKLVLNKECPACGMTRAMSRLLHLDFIGAWNFNKLVFIVFGLMIFLLIKDIIKIKK